MAAKSHRTAYISTQFKKLLSREHIGRLARDPSIAVKTIKTYFFDKNLVERTADTDLQIYQNSIASLASLVSPQLPGFYPFEDEDEGARELGALFTHYGSDKANKHDYHRIYGRLLAGKRNEQLKILEIGLGTNDLSITSNMGLRANPGASLRAFRDWAPHATVIGADVDKRILFSDDRIVTYWVDQSDLSSLVVFASKCDGPFDLIIDDGLHLPYANFNTLATLLPLLKPDGAFVIEDIEIGHLPFWQIACAALPKFVTRLVNAKDGVVFVLQHK